MNSNIFASQMGAMLMEYHFMCLREPKFFDYTFMTWVLTVLLPRA